MRPVLGVTSCMLMHLLFSWANKDLSLTFTNDCKPQDPRILVWGAHMCNYDYKLRVDYSYTCNNY